MTDEIGSYYIFDVETKESVLPTDSQDVLEHNLKELLSSEFLLCP